MPALIRRTDGKARVSLPKAFVNATVLIEQVGDTELRIRKAQVVPKDEMAFREEAAVPLSDRDRDRFLTLLAKPPSAKKTLREAVAKRQRRHA